MDITIRISDMNVQFMLLYKLINHVVNCNYDVRRYEAAAKILYLLS